MSAPNPQLLPPLVPPDAPPRSWVHRRVLAPLLDLLKTGLSPEKLALTIGLGVAFGLAPTFGITTLVSTATALRLRLNVAALQLVAHLMTAFQLTLLIPLLRGGARLLGHGAQVAHLTIKSLRALIANDGWGAVGRLLWRAEIGALLIWAVAAVPLVTVIYFVLRPVFRRVLARQVEAEAIAALNGGISS
ncbi:DUF2062 domain-containing protein [Hymenobacter terrenus]|uniref:DUF2062 domain-containing protein n=1 Tax=Hymenobacter terrenus TaxID=1629124 RepID=UPI000697937E|nr:DUF2062 domain-containing protein [Hymenobacter terrenus]